MNKPCISLIMPVYNSENYIEKTIQSVLKQTFEDFELIIVDDGSIDGSKKICDDYALCDKRIIVVHKQNGGVCSARNVGIAYSSGQYIGFIDDDDIYEDRFCEILYKTMIKDESDFIKCGRKNIKITLKQDVLSEVECTYYETGMFHINEFLEQYYTFKKSDILGPVWNGLYKRQIILENYLTFDENIKHGNEDIIFNTLYLRFCRKISIVKDVLYVHYYRISHSTSMKFYDDQISTRIRAIKLERALCINKNYIQDLIELEGIRECFRLLLNSNSWEQQKDAIVNIKNELNFSLLKKYKILKIHEFSNVAKIDLLLIKLKMYKLYFFLRKIYLKIR